jgi:hypothetical protein
MAARNARVIFACFICEFPFSRFQSGREWPSFVRLSRDRRWYPAPGSPDCRAIAELDACVGIGDEIRLVTIASSAAGVRCERYLGMHPHRAFWVARFPLCEIKAGTTGVAALQP